MDKLCFGTAGVPLSAAGLGTEKGIERVRQLGLDCMELEFVQGVRMGKELANRVQEVAKLNDVALSAHAPYYINLNAMEPEKLAASKERILQAAEILNICGGLSVVFHLGFYLKQDPEEVYGKIKSQMQELQETLHERGICVVLRPETTGKDSQIGALREILNLCTEVKGILPCIDFSHLYARSIGKLNSYEDFAAILAAVLETLGRPALDNFHAHVAGMEYGAKGEKRHLVLRESGFNYRDLLRALKDFQVKGLVICESPNLEEDALLLKETYYSL